jgi:hypothetical protein
MDQKRKIIINTIGYFLLFYGLFAIFFSIYRGKPSWIFWFCYISMAIIGLGTIRKNGYLVASQINLLFFYLIFWDIDFLYRLITKTSLWGISDYFFGEMLLLARLISLEHLFLLPLAFFVLYLLKTEKGDHWKISIIQAVLLAGLTRFLTLEQYNVNCMFHSCAPFIPNGTFYPFIWIGLNIISILVTAFIINKIKVFRR